MMIDLESLFSDGQTPTLTHAAVTSSTNVLDWHAHGDDIDKVLRLTVVNTVAAVSANQTATLAISWQTSANNSDWTTLRTWTAVAASAMTAGTFLINNAALPDGLKRYNKLVYTNAVEAFTTGPKLSAFVSPDCFIAR